MHFPAHFPAHSPESVQGALRVSVIITYGGVHCKRPVVFLQCGAADVRNGTMKARLMPGQGSAMRHPFTEKRYGLHIALLGKQVICVIAGLLDLFDLLAGVASDQAIHGHAKIIHRDWKQSNVRVGCTHFPLADSLTGYAQCFRDLFLYQASLFPHMLQVLKKCFPFM